MAMGTGLSLRKKTLFRGLFADLVVVRDKHLFFAHRHSRPNGHYTFRGSGQVIDLDAIVARLELLLAVLTEFSAVWAYTPKKHRLKTARASQRL